MGYLLPIDRADSFRHIAGGSRGGLFFGQSVHVRASCSTNARLCNSPAGTRNRAVMSHHTMTRNRHRQDVGPPRPIQPHGPISTNSFATPTSLTAIKISVRLLVIKRF